MDCCRRWNAARGGSLPNIPVKKCTRSGDGLRHDMYRYRIRMDNWWWMTGDGPQELDHGKWKTITPLSNMRIWRLSKVIPFSKSHTVISNNEYSMERRDPDTRCTASGMVPASLILTIIQNASPSTIQRSRIKPLHAGVTMLNTIPYEITSHTAAMPIPHIMMLYESSFWQCKEL